jgi:hypothetical protein
MQRGSGSGLTYVCPGCRGTLLGLSPLEHLLADNLGNRIWTATAEPGGPTAGACPYCTQPMRQPDPSAGAPEGLAVCRFCQEVWYPASAADWLAAHARAGESGAGSVALPAPRPTHCDNCGAPFTPDEAGHCPYCHEQIAPPAPIVVIQQAAPQFNIGRAALGIGIGGAVLDAVLRQID